MKQPHYNQNGYEYIKIAKAIIETIEIDSYIAILWFNIGKYWWRMFYENTTKLNRATLI